LLKKLSSKSSTFGAASSDTKLETTKSSKKDIQDILKAQLKNI